MTRKFLEPQTAFDTNSCYNKQSLWSDLAIALRSEFPKLVSYSRFVELMPGTLLPLCVYLYSRRGQQTGIAFIDSTPLAVCHTKRIRRHVANPKTAPGLLQAGARLAQARNGLLFVLKVLPLAEQMPAHLKQQTAQRELESLSALVQQVGLESAAVKPVVLLAPYPAAGILEAASDRRVDLLLLGWQGEHLPGDTPPDSILDPVIKRAPCSVAILRGSVPELVKQVLVPTACGPYAPQALALGRDLAEPGRPRILVENMVEEHLTPEREAQARTEVRKTLEPVKNRPEVKERVLEVDDIRAGIIDQAEAADLLLIGASRKGYPERPFFGGLAADVAAAAAPPTILTRGREAGRPWWQRLWDTLTDPLPTLTLARQAEVYQNMRESAQPSIDFFVRITLAAVIASLGLLLNSGAVIIGAMLVAPLMSPILAMAMSMVHGNLRLLMVAAGTTAKGITLAIIVGFVVVIISSIETATDQILARTAPNILDLMVALASGAAAGYAISRKEVAAALPGVAIAAALVPPLCVVGYGLGTSQLDIAVGSLLLFTTNLIAIILAAGLTFLALGFHPSRTEQHEVLRGFKVTAVFYSIIFLILAFTTVASVTRLNREVSIEAIFTDEVVARAGEVRELTIEHDGNGFLITATIIDIEGNQLAPAEITNIQEELTASVGGPVIVRATVIPATLVDFTGFDRRRELEDSFRGQIAEQGAQIAEMTVEESEAGFAIIASVISFEDDALTDAALATIQANLSEAMAAPVNIQAAILPARQVNVGSASAAQPPNAEND